MDVRPPKPSFPYKGTSRLALLRDSRYKMLLHGGETMNDGKDPNEANQQHINGRLLHNGRNGHFTPEGRALSAMSRFEENARMLCDPTWFRRAEHHQRAIMELPGGQCGVHFFSMPREQSPYQLLRVTMIMDCTRRKCGVYGVLLSVLVFFRAFTWMGKVKIRYVFVTWPDSQF